MMDFVVNEEAANAEQTTAFRQVGAQFKRFYDAMLAEGLPDDVAKRLTASYGGVVCDLLYLERDSGE